MVRDDNGAGGWRGGAVARRRPRYEWKPGSGIVRRGPRAAGWALGLAALACVAAFAYLLYLLAQPPRAYFVLVAADPAADPLNLAAPLDVRGWQSAGHFQAAAARWGAVASAPTPLPPDDEPATLKDWLGQFRPPRGVRRYGPVVMYLGVHAGTRAVEGGPPEPVLFAGGGKPVRIRRLVEAIAEWPTHDRGVVLLLDPSRFRPDPADGSAWDDFADGMKALAPEVEKVPNLVVVCGADGHQRGWESEELRATAFAHAVIGAVDAREAVGRTRVVSAWELFEDAGKRLAAWTANNRPSVQTALLLPLGRAGEGRAREIRLASRPADPVAWDAAAPPSAGDLKEWEQLWAARAERLKHGPHPATYAPRAWRRYEQLLLRHEAAVRAGLPQLAGTLAGAARVAADDLAAPYGPVFRTKGTLPASFSQALAFDALREPTAFDPTAALWELAQDKGPGLPTAAGDPMTRPSERHLAAMVQRFYRGIAPAPAPPPAWRDAIGLKVRAERAALGLPAPGVALVEPIERPQPVAALSERVWPLVAKSVADADARRRKAEDELFGPDAPPLPTELTTGYDPAARVAAELRFAYLVRDVAFAELPDLGRWTAVTGRDAGRVVGVWTELYRLDTVLAESPPDPARAAATAATVWAGVGELAADFRRAVHEESDAALPAEWLSKEDLLATALPTPDERKRLLGASREASFKLIGETRSARPETLAADASAKWAAAHAAWSKVTAGEVGLDGASRAEVAAVHRGPVARAGGAGYRVTVAPAPGAEPADEPAAVAGRLAWAELFDALAVRAELDFWYDEAPPSNRPPYYRRAADRYRADAAFLRGGAVPPPVAARPLGLTATDGSGPISWTSEQRRELGFLLRVPDDTPAGTAVRVPRLDATTAPLRLSAPTARAASLPIRPGTQVAVSVGLEATSDDEAPGRAAAGVGVFFRGQWQQQQRTIDVNRRPELVVTDPGPGASAAAVAVRADPSQPLPPVVVLLDYSGSMKEGLNGFRLPGPEDAWKAGPSKFNKMLVTLEATLAELPKGTPLRVRLFSAQDMPDWDAVVYPAPGEAGVVDWQGGDTAKLRDLMARLRRAVPHGTTPLIQAIVAAARDDFPARADGPKTLVVLTDGADDSGRPGVPAEERDALKAMLKNTLATTRVKLVAVQFALNEADRTTAAELFADLGALDVPAEVVNAANGEALRHALVAAVWPRLVLGGGAGTLGRYPAGGWPARPPRPPAADTGGTLDPNTLYWSPALAPGGGTYAARVAGWPDAARKLPAVGLATGDFLPLSLSRAGESFLLRRELHADAISRTQKALRTDGRWMLSVPAAGVVDVRERPRFEALTFLENVPPHRRPTPVDEPEPVLRHVLPGSVWWHAGPVNEPAEAGPPVGWEGRKTVVSRRYGYPAPAWDVGVVGRPGSGAEEFGQLAVTAWVSDAVPPPQVRFTAPVPGPGSEGTIVADGRTYRLTVEPVRFATADAPMSCLVIRTEYPAGDPVQVRLATPPPGVRAEHRYYRLANGYTAAFGPWPESAGGAGVVVEVIRVSGITGGVGASVQLVLPPPPVGRRPDTYVPQPTSTGP